MEKKKEEVEEEEEEKMLESIVSNAKDFAVVEVTCSPSPHRLPQRPPVI